MAGKFRANLTHLRTSGVQVRVAAFGLQEGYSTGWSGTALVVGSGGDEPLSAGTMMSAVMASGVVAGTAMGLNLAIDGGPLDGANVRSWPCVVSGLRPYPIDQFNAACDVHLLDPVSALAEQPIWGAYRAVSAAEAVGGALSLAAGGDGKPTLNPILPRLPPVRIAPDYREALAKLPYVIATGEALGDWLADFLATLGLRAELRGFDDGRLVVTLADARPRRKALEMSVVTSTGVDPPSTDSVGPILLQGHSAFPGTPLRGALLDDPTKGSARPLVASGPIGTVMTDTGLDVDEATARVYQEVKGSLAEMLMVTALSRQPRFRPGEMVRLSRPTHGLTDWQVSSVSHWLRSAAYDNDATLIRGDFPWHPELPPYRPPVYVSAVVDGGIDYDFHQPVPRDRLGQVKVTFPFTPTPQGDEAAHLVAADTDRDRRVTLEDFDADQLKTYSEDTAHWEAEDAKYQAGDYNDPFPGKDDEDLTEDEKEQREDLYEKRKAVIAYRAYLEAVVLDRQDRDRDGVISSRDSLVSDELSAALRDDSQRQELEDALAAAKKEEEEEENTEDGDEEGEDGDDSDQDVEDEEEEEEEPEDPLTEEYKDLFGDDDDVSEEVVEARIDAEEMADRWPPRIALPVIKPMAGALHGFITAHRHGDSCRVAVHSPFSAEIVGFQYRDDRKINADLSDSVAGLVVEHNYAQAWSGLVFRRAEAMDGGDDTAENKSEENGGSTGTKKPKPAPVDTTKLDADTKDTPDQTPSPTQTPAPTPAPPPPPTPRPPMDPPPRTSGGTGLPPGSPSPPPPPPGSAPTGSPQSPGSPPPPPPGDASDGGQPNPGGSQPPPGTQPPAGEAPPVSGTTPPGNGGMPGGHGGTPGGNQGPGGFPI